MGDRGPQKPGREMGCLGAEGPSTTRNQSSPPAPGGYGRRLLERVDRDIVGLRREAEILSAALEAGRHVVLEGPPGTGKSSLLRAAPAAPAIGMGSVGGNAERTPPGRPAHHDPRLGREGADR